MTFFLIFITTFCFMEFWAWFAHRYIMHGFLWFLHRDHHQKERGRGFFERNDWFFMIFATPGIACLIFWKLYGDTNLLAIGLGITAYGAAYFLLHDVFIHQRFKWFKRSNHPYLLAIRRAHIMHHKHLEKTDGESFGMLVVSWEYFKAAFNKKQHSREIGAK